MFVAFFSICAYARARVARARCAPVGGSRRKTVSGPAWGPPAGPSCRPKPATDDTRRHSVTLQDKREIDLNPVLQSAWEEFRGGPSPVPSRPIPRRSSRPIPREAHPPYRPLQGRGSGIRNRATRSAGRPSHDAGAHLLGAARTAVTPSQRSTAYSWTARGHAVTHKHAHKHMLLTFIKCTGREAS